MSDKKKKKMMLVEASRMREVANYVGATQELIKKHAAFEKAFSNLAPQVADIMIRHGQLDQHLKEAKVKSFVDNPDEFCNAVLKVASMNKSDETIGEGVDKSASNRTETADEVFCRRLFGSA